MNLRRGRAAHAAVANVRSLVAEKDVAGAKSALSLAQSALDKAAKRGVIKKGSASRKKARLSALIKRSR